MFAGAHGDREAAHPGGARTLAGRRGHPGHRRPRSRRSGRLILDGRLRRHSWTLAHARLYAPGRALDRGGVQT